jgi:hypothetical protein
VKLIVRYRSIAKMLADAFDEGRRHVDANVCNLIGRSTVPPVSI